MHIPCLLWADGQIIQGHLNNQALGNLLPYKGFQLVVFVNYLKYQFFYQQRGFWEQQ